MDDGEVGPRRLEILQGDEDLLIEPAEPQDKLAVSGSRLFPDLDASGAELLARVASQGPTAVARVAPFQERRSIFIPLVYGAALL